MEPWGNAGQGRCLGVGFPVSGRRSWQRWGSGAGEGVTWRVTSGSQRGKGKLGGSEKGVRLTIFPLEEAELCEEAACGQGQQGGGGKVTAKACWWDRGQGGLGQGGERQRACREVRDGETC